MTNLYNWKQGLNAYLKPGRFKICVSSQDNHKVEMRTRYMDWNTAIMRFNIPKKFQNVLLADTMNLNPRIASFGKKWILSPKKPSLYLYGNTGSGKTHFSFVLLRSLIDLKMYPWIIYTRSNELDDELLQATLGNQEKTKLEKYSEVPILFIDDLGVERPTDRIIKQYYNIIDFRSNNELITIYTSNLSNKDISINLGERISSRLQTAMQIQFPDKDLRKK